MQDIQIKLSQKRIDTAKKNQLNIYLTTIDLNKEKIELYTEFIEKVTEFENNLKLIKKGILTKYITPLNTKNNLFYYFLYYHTVKEESNGFLLNEYWPSAQTKCIYRINEQSINPSYGNSNTNHYGQTTSVEEETIENSENTLIRTEILNHLVHLTGETVLLRNSLNNAFKKMDPQELLKIGKRLNQSISELQNWVMKTRTQTVDGLFSKIHSSTNQYNREIQLYFIGEKIEIDKTLLGTISEPITKLVEISYLNNFNLEENKADHFIEVKAFNRNEKFILTIKDNGEKANTKSIKEKYDLSNIEKIFLKIGGTIDIQIVEEKETLITIIIPQTLSILTCLNIKIEHKIFALQQYNIVELIRVNEKSYNIVEGHPVYELRKKIIPLMNLAEHLKLINNSKKISENSNNSSIVANIKDKFIAFVRSDKYFYGIIFDEILEFEETVLKNLSYNYTELSYLAGVGVLGSGKISMILDISKLAEHAHFTSNSELKTDLNKENENQKLDKQETQVQYLMLKVSDKLLAMPMVVMPKIEKFDSSKISNSLGVEIIQIKDKIVHIIRLNTILQITSNSKQENKAEYIVVYEYKNQYIGLIVDEAKEIKNELIMTNDQENHEKGIILGETILKDDIVLILNILTISENMIQQINKVGNINE